jgi:hypothetical protein
MGVKRLPRKRKKDLKKSWSINPYIIVPLDLTISEPIKFIQERLDWYDAFGSALMGLPKSAFGKQESLIKQQ